MKILDWKNVKIATATLDLAFLMLSSTKSDMRSESTSEILSTYHDVFSQYLSVLNPHLEKPTIEELEADYYKSLEYAILQVCTKIYACNRNSFFKFYKPLSIIELFIIL